MDGYYDEHPLFSLERHLALVSLVTADTRRIGHRLAALTGLPFLDLERLVEHDQGASLWDLLLGEGLASFREAERQSLKRALADRPCGVLVLGDSTLLDEQSRRSIQSETTLVSLDRDLANCYWRFQKIQREQLKTLWHPLFPDPLTSIDQIRPFYQERQPTLSFAHHKISLVGSSAHQVVHHLMNILPAADRFDPS